MIEWILAVLLLVSLLYLIWKYFELKGQIETRSKDIFERWKSKELERLSKEKANLLFQEWKQKEEGEIRKDAIKRSQAVTKGKITEHLIPFFPNFKHNPKDVRFIGTPIDLIIFDGLSEGNLKKIVFAEIKTGKTAALSTRERKVRNAIQNKDVEYSYW